MNKNIGRNFSLLIAVLGGVIIAFLTLFLIACLHMVKLFFSLFIQKERFSSKTRNSKQYEYSEKNFKMNDEVNKRKVKTIEAEVVSVESKSINS